MKCKKRLLSLVLAFIISISMSLPSYAAGLSASFSDQQMLLNDPLYQEFVAQYGSAHQVSAETTYVVTEYVKDDDGNVQAIPTAYETLPTEYANPSGISPFNVSPGGEQSLSFSVIKVTLAYHAPNSSTSVSGNRYYVMSKFEWITLPSPAAGKTLQGACGLCFDTQLAIDGTSYSGHLNGKRNVNGRTVTIDQDLPITATSVNGIAGKFSFSHNPTIGGTTIDCVTALSGYVSCIANKTNSGNTHCSALAEYQDVSVGLMNGLSISFPAGMSFGIGNVTTSYPVQDTLVL